MRDPTIYGNSSYPPLPSSLQLACLDDEDGGEPITKIAKNGMIIIIKITNKLIIIIMIITIIIFLLLASFFNEEM
jgi:hypothetical protein